MAVDIAVTFICACFANLKAFDEADVAIVATVVPSKAVMRCTSLLLYRAIAGSTVFIAVATPLRTLDKPSLFSGIAIDVTACSTSLIDEIILRLAFSMLFANAEIPFAIAVLSSFDFLPISVIMSKALVTSDRLIKSPPRGLFADFHVYGYCNIVSVTA